MARTINEIQTGINTALEAGTEVKLSTSKVAEWRLWTWIVATAIQAFEVILDLFKKEVQEKRIRSHRGRYAGTGNSVCVSRTDTNSFSIRIRQPCIMRKMIRTAGL